MFLSLICVAGTAAAQGKAADEMDTQARAYFRAGAFEQAAEAFVAAYGLQPKSNRLFNAGRAYEEAGNTRKASELFARFLTLESSGDKVTEARARKAKLDSEIAEEDRQAAEAAAKTAKAEAARKHAEEGQEQLRTQDYVSAAASFEAAYQSGGDAEYLYDKAEALRLGKQRAEAIAAYLRYQREAPTGRNIDLARTRQRELEEEASAPTTTTPVTTTPTTTSAVDPAAATVTKKAAHKDSGNSALRVSGIVGLSIGAVLLSGGAIFAIDAKSKENDLEGLDPQSGESWDQAAYDDGKDSAKKAMGLSVAGGVLALTGAILFYVGRGDDSAANDSVSLTPSVDSHSAGFALGGSF